MPAPHHHAPHQHAGHRRVPARAKDDSLTELSRRFAVGAESLGTRGTHFRVWAPHHRHVEVVSVEVAGAGNLEALSRARTGAREASVKLNGAYPLELEDPGYFSGWAPELRPGARYYYRLGGEKALYPDPASRFQPFGPHGPSEVVDPGRFRWKAPFPGPLERGQVIYELHIGTFTREGTYAAAAGELEELARLGVTTIELMPLSEFPGEFGWGYDGVALWAPSHLYGGPEELRAFIDSAHQAGIAVILDVVYNHLGPDGNYLDAFAPSYFTDRYPNEWGKALNFDGDGSAPVREFFTENARYWIDEYHFDGLRLDATQSIIDNSKRHVLCDITEAARGAARARGGRVYICAENEPQEVRIAEPVAQGGHGCDALWNDDFHHTARVALTGRREAYYHDYLGSPQELISALRWGYLYQGQHYQWQKKRRGQSALGLGAETFITYLQNHDQVANSLAGHRIQRLTSPAKLRALTTLWLLAPPTPMLFMGQEFGASTPFLYFADHNPELAPTVRRGRQEFLRQFPSIANGGASERLDDPAARASFERCKLDFSEREKNAPLYELHVELLALRRNDASFASQRADLMHGATLAPQAFSLRFFHPGGDRLITLNLGPDLKLDPAPEPLLAPRTGRRWKRLLSSEDVAYGGNGYAEPHVDGVWFFSAESASVFREEAE